MRTDYGCNGNGTANIFMLFSPFKGWRHVDVMDRRLAVDYAYILGAMSDRWFPDAAKIADGQDISARGNWLRFMRPFRPPRRAASSNVENGATPKRGGWLNLAETEFSVLALQRREGCISTQQDVDRIGRCLGSGPKTNTTQR